MDGVGDKSWEEEKEEGALRKFILDGRGDEGKNGGGFAGGMGKRCREC